jgi:hypothetical protein
MSIKVSTSLQEHIIKGAVEEEHQEEDLGKPEMQKIKPRWLHQYQQKKP